ncbi:hypothetical protein F7725_022064 [Dissostichus mawsoni]|uniref:Uncharacterized protein n=1 Tax=Dissostichus mawsoni TaxID=36200 RepID=A0A7J5ZCW4_DISMA|nr:hypothetical protein F7725_022064 [Dissostichus mawsoni]
MVRERDDAPGRRCSVSVSPSSGLEDEVGVGSAFRVLVSRPALPVGVRRSGALSQGRHHLWNTGRGISFHSWRQLLHPPHPLLLLRLLLVEVIRRQHDELHGVGDLVLFPPDDRFSGAALLQLALQLQRDRYVQLVNLHRLPAALLHRVNNNNNNIR